MLGMLVDETRGFVSLLTKALTTIVFLFFFSRIQLRRFVLDNLSFVLSFVIYASQPEFMGLITCVYA